MSSRLSIAIVGSGGAAAHAVMALRAAGSRAAVHLFTDTATGPFNPMLLPYYLAGEIEQEACHPFGAGRSFYEKHDVQAHLGAKVTRLDAEARTLRTAGGEGFEYEQCLLATGASPLRPRLPGLQDGRVHTLRGMADAEGLKKALSSRPRRAVVVGASMIGIQVAELLRLREIPTVLADAAEQVFPLAAHPSCAAILKERLSRQRVSVLLGAALEGIERAPSGLRVHFAGHGHAEEADLVVLALGVQPNLGLLDPGQVAFDKGVLVDEQLRTSMPGLYAAGDVSQGLNLLTGRKEVIGLWSNACHQGRCAGRNLAGLEDTYRGGIPANVVRFFDSLFVTMGEGRSEQGQVDFPYPGEEAFCRLVADEGHLVGANLIDCCQGAGLLRQAMLRGTAKRTMKQQGWDESRPENQRLDWSLFTEKLFRAGDRSIASALLGREI